MTKPAPGDREFPAEEGLPDATFHAELLGDDTTSREWTLKHREEARKRGLSEQLIDIAHPLDPPETK